MIQAHYYASGLAPDLPTSKPRVLRYFMVRYGSTQYTMTESSVMNYRFYGKSLDRWNVAHDS